MHYAVMVGCWYWNKRKLNDDADKNTEQAFLDITKAINGGVNGLADRKTYLTVCKKVFGG